MAAVKVAEVRAVADRADVEWGVEGSVAAG